MLEFHPLANVFPLLEGSEFAALVDNIAATGLIEPVWLYEGMILDGRNRYRACTQLERHCPTRPYTGDDPVKFVISMNLTRRHLDESQRAMAAARLAEIQRGRNQHVQIRTPTRQDAAELLNVGLVAVSLAHKIQQKGIPDLAHAVDAGELAVSAASPLTALTKDEQPAALAEARATAKGHKVTAVITKAIVTRKEVLDTLQGALDTGASSTDAIRQALTTHDITVPTPGLADALARAVPGAVSIPATDGLYHDGRTAQEEGDRKAYVQQLFQLFRALEALATLPDPGEMASDIPSYSTFRVDTHLEAALGWLTAFTAIWRDTHGERSAHTHDLVRSY